MTKTKETFVEKLARIREETEEVKVKIITDFILPLEEDMKGLSEIGAALPPSDALANSLTQLTAFFSNTILQNPSVISYKNQKSMDEQAKKTPIPPSDEKSEPSSSG